MVRSGKISYAKATDCPLHAFLAMISRFLVTIFSLVGVLFSGAHAVPTSLVERQGVTVLSSDQVGFITTLLM